MDLGHLQNFVVVAERLHFRGAAETLATAQPTLSYQIRVLERELGAKLFERTKRRVYLTDAGTVLLAEAQRVLAQFEVLRARVQEAAHGERGTLVIGSSAASMLTYLPEVVERFRALHPEVTLRIRVLAASDVMAALRSHEIQIGFSRPLPEVHEFASQPLGEYPLMVLLPQGHRAAAASEVSLRDLQGETLAMFSHRIIGESQDQVIALCRDQGCHPEKIEEVESIESMLGLVSCGLAFAVLPSPWAAMHLPAVVFRPIAGAGGWALKTAAFWRENDSSALVPAFVDVAVAQTRIIVRSD